MEINKYITLFESSVTTEKAKATALIKSTLIECKEKHLSFNFVINHLIDQFLNYEKKHLTNRADLKFLYDVFEKGKRNYENGMSLLVIPYLLKPTFDKLGKIDISFEEYLMQLANRVSYTRTITEFQANDKLFGAIYSIGQFDGYVNLPDFDVKMFNYEPNYFELEKEIFDLAFGKSNIATTCNIPPGADKQGLQDNFLPSNNLFQFQGKHLASMQSREIFEAISENYFDPITSFDDYLNVFFKDPEDHQSKIYLNCKTTTFAKLLDEFKENIAWAINFTEIEKSELFITHVRRITLTRANLSNALSKSTQSDKKAALAIINTVLNLTKNVKKTYS